MFYTQLLFEHCQLILNNQKPNHKLQAYSLVLVQMY